MVKRKQTGGNAGCFLKPLSKAELLKVRASEKAAKSRRDKRRKLAKKKKKEAEERRFRRSIAGGQHFTNFMLRLREEKRVKAEKKQEEKENAKTKMKMENESSEPQIKISPEEYRVPSTHKNPAPFRVRRDLNGGETLEYATQRWVRMNVRHIVKRGYHKGEMWLKGTTEKHSIAVKCQDFKPYLKIRVPAKWGRDEMEGLQKTLNRPGIRPQGMFNSKKSPIASMHYERRIPGFGFSGLRRDTLLRIHFHSNWVRKKYRDDVFSQRSLTVCGLTLKFQMVDPHLSLEKQFEILTPIADQESIMIDTRNATFVDNNEHETNCQLEMSCPMAAFTKMSKRELEEFKPSPPVTVTFDIECFSAHNPGAMPDYIHKSDAAYQVGCVVTTDDECKKRTKVLFTLGTCTPIPNHLIYCYSTEAQLLLGLWLFLTQFVRVDRLVGFNSIGFDLPYLVRRAQKLGVRRFIQLGMFRDEDSSEGGGKDKHDNHERIDMHGVEHVDVMKVAKSPAGGLKLSSYTLKDVAKAALKTDVKSNDFMFKDLIHDTKFKYDHQKKRKRFLETLQKKSNIHFLPTDKTPEVPTPAPKLQKTSTLQPSNAKISNQQINGKDGWFIPKNECSSSRVIPLPRKKKRALGKNQRKRKSCIVDLPETFGSSSSTSSSTSVKDQFSEDVGKKKLDLPYHLLIPTFRKGPDGRQESAMYCIGDVLVTLEIAVSQNMFRMQTECSRLYHTSLNDIMNRGTVWCTQNQLTIRMYEMGYYSNIWDLHAYNQKVAHLFLTKDDKKGGLVLVPKVGLHLDPTNTLDFKSLYPTTMIASNICFSTICFNEAAVKLAKKMGYKVLTINVGKGDSLVCYIVQGVQSIIPSLERTLLAARQVEKDKKKKAGKDGDWFMYAVYDAKQKSFKLACNAMYGFLGAPFNPDANRGKGSGNPMQCLSLMTAVTAFGRGMTQLTKDLGNTHFPGADVLYGDTDSVMIKFQPPKDLFTRTNHIAKFNYNREMSDKACMLANSQFRDPVELEYEYIHWKFMLLKKKGYASDKRKKSTDKATLSASGLKNVKRDTSALARNVFQFTLNSIMIHNDVEGAIQYLQTALDELLAGNIPVKDLGISKKFNTYEVKGDSAGSQVTQMANRIRDADPDKALKTSTRISYVQRYDPGLYEKNRQKSETNKKNMKVGVSECAELVSSVAENPNMQIDLPFYVNEIRAPMMDSKKYMGMLSVALQDKPKRLREVKAMFDSAHDRAKSLLKGDMFLTQFMT